MRENSQTKKQDSEKTRNKKVEPLFLNGFFLFKQDSVNKVVKNIL